MNIREFYLKSYPLDELGFDINESATFVGLLHAIHTEQNVYQYIGVYDSLIRESIFEELANILGVNYGYVFDLWMNEIKAHHNNSI